jgi:tRNA(Ile)-lysidine synthase
MAGKYRCKTYTIYLFGQKFSPKLAIFGPIMLDAFAEFISRENLCSPTDSVLLAVSGGPDSVLLAHLFAESGYRIGIAHCNYQLRGDDSLADEAFVRQLASNMGVPFFGVSFDTRKLVAGSGKSVQEAARDLRYEWLESIRLREGYDLIATGHHLNDSIETLLFNFAKGCGIRGLHGILPKRGHLIRPLLFAAKDQILGYLEGKEIPYRLDRSNEEEYYDRNKLRHGVIPVLQSINPDFEAGAGDTIQRIREAERFYEFGIGEWVSHVTTLQKGQLVISWEELQKSPAPPTLLFEILSPFGFRFGQFQSLLQQKELRPGRRWYSPTHCLLSDRKELLLAALNEEQLSRIEIPEGSEEISLPEGILYIRYLDQAPPEWPENKREVYLDAEKLRFPLLLRRWEAGDYFHPLGLGGKSKKLQDLFSDLKMSGFEKEKTWILDISGQIAWVVGHRMDESFKMQAASTKCLHLRFDRPPAGQ